MVLIPVLNLSHLARSGMTYGLEIPCREPLDARRRARVKVTHSNGIVRRAHYTAGCGMASRDGAQTVMPGRSKAATHDKMQQTVWKGDSDSSRCESRRMGLQEGRLRERIMCAQKALPPRGNRVGDLAATPPLAGEFGVSRACLLAACLLPGEC